MKKKKELSYDSGTPLLNIYPREIKSRISKRNHTPVFTAALQQPKGGGNTRAHWWMDAWTKCGLYVQWNYYSALKRKAVPTHATPWMSLEGILLSGISQSQRANVVWFHLQEGPRIVEFREQAEGWGLGVWGGRWCFVGTESQFEMMKML